MSHPYVIRLVRGATNDMMMHDVGLGASAAPGVYRSACLQFNEQGAISVMTPNGWFGIKPGEFEWVSEPHPCWNADGTGIHDYRIRPEPVARIERLQADKDRMLNAMQVAVCIAYEADEQEIAEYLEIGMGMCARVSADSTRRVYENPRLLSVSGGDPPIAKLECDHVLAKGVEGDTFGICTRCGGLVARGA